MRVLAWKRSLGALIPLVALLRVAPNAAVVGVDQVSAPGAPPASNGRVLETEKQKQSYAIGLNVGRQLRRQRIDLDLDVFIRGLEHARSGARPLLAEPEAAAIIGRLRTPPQAVTETQAAAPTVSRIVVSFKLDTSLTRGMYMGERWVSPPKFISLHNGDTATVEAKALGVAGNGTTSSITPRWVPGDPEMVQVDPSEGTPVRIIVRRPGRTGLRVQAGEITKELVVTATARDDKTLTVEISQDSTGTPAGAVR